MSGHSSARGRAHLITTAVAVVMTFFALVLNGFPAHADATTDVDAAAQQFQAGSHVYVSPAAGQQLDQVALDTQIGKSAIYVAVLAANQNPSDADNALISAGLPSATIVVISGTQYTAQSAVLCSGVATKLLSETRAKHSEVAQGELTKWLIGYVGAIGKTPTQTAAKCDATDGGAGTPSPASGSILPWMILIGVLGLGGGVYFINHRKNQRNAALRGRHEQVMDLFNQLHADLQHIKPSGSAIAQQALSDASERYHYASNILSAAENDEEYEAAGRACIEGLTASEAARHLLELGSGGPIPALGNAAGEQLQAPTEVRIGEQAYRGYPSYTPGAVHYFDGGGGYLAGWYDGPFWQSFSEGATFGGLFDDSAEPQDDEADERRSAAHSSGFDGPSGTDQFDDRS